MNIELPIIPGRGLVNATSMKMRLDYLSQLKLNADNLSSSSLDIKILQKNIESYIGSVEIPVGIVGPLKFIDNKKEELVYTVAGTLEGALIASMNRGAKAISLSGGFEAKIKWQRMCRSPLFLFEKIDDAILLNLFIQKNFGQIKAKAESYSNHAKLVSIDSSFIENSLHAKFVYETGDASGQNMTTTCTWHALLFIVETFQKETGITIPDFVIEGNGSSDKKISEYATQNGRGVNVTAYCFLPEHVIKQTLRTSAPKLKRIYDSSVQMARNDGMKGYNINVANAVASIFIATGQDLACIHESSVGILEIDCESNGLTVKLNLPNLVIGTVGGGTHLPKQTEALDLMGCKGGGKVERFAKLIAGFAMGLELSTFAAVVSGEFAKSHEKLGRNKPVEWLVRNEINSQFLQNCLIKKHDIISIELSNKALLENGILTHIASRTSKKIIGFETIVMNEIINANVIEKEILMKSKALDEEVIKGLHLLAASIDPELSNLIKENKEHLEYKNCHLKETIVYEFFHKLNFSHVPQYYGRKIDHSREIHLLFIEKLQEQNIELINSEMTPELWDGNRIKICIDAANKFHTLFKNYVDTDDSLRLLEVSPKPWEANGLYNKIIQILYVEETDSNRRESLIKLKDAALILKKIYSNSPIRKTIIHNDYNPRNIAICVGEKPIIYDWELAVLHYPHRDIIELLAFTLPENFSDSNLFMYLDYHTVRNPDSNNLSAWNQLYYYACLELIITRLLFYEVAGIVVKYEFSNRVLNVAFRMLKILERYA